MAMEINIPEISSIIVMKYHTDIIINKENKQRKDIQHENSSH